ncbi:MAG: hypothetical protein FWG03_08000 [Clostridiales bacterium]|nr:hypothetical protein [Clostridiales bacterium]
MPQRTGDVERKKNLPLLHEKDGALTAMRCETGTSAMEFQRSEPGLWRLQTPPETSALCSRSVVLETKPAREAL